MEHLVDRLARTERELGIARDTIADSERERTSLRIATPMLLPLLPPLLGLRPSMASMISLASLICSSLPRIRTAFRSATAST